MLFLEAKYKSLTVLASADTDFTIQLDMLLFKRFKFFLLSMILKCLFWSLFNDNIVKSYIDLEVF